VYAYVPASVRAVLFMNDGHPELLPHASIITFNFGVEFQRTFPTEILMPVKINYYYFDAFMIQLLLTFLAST